MHPVQQPWVVVGMIAIMFMVACAQSWIHSEEVEVHSLDPGFLRQWEREIADVWRLHGAIDDVIPLLDDIIAWFTMTS